MLYLNMFNKYRSALKAMDLADPVRRVFVGLLALGLVVALVWLLMRTGAYGLMLFTVVPVALGALAAWCIRPQTLAEATQAGLVRQPARIGGTACLRAGGNHLPPDGIASDAAARRIGRRPGLPSERKPSEGCWRGNAGAASDRRNWLGFNGATASI